MERFFIASVSVIGKYEPKVTRKNFSALLFWVRLGTSWCCQEGVAMSNNKKICTFLWFVENYSYCNHKINEKLDSPVFTIRELEGTAWNMHLYPRGKSVADRGNIVVYLKRNEDDGPDLFTLKYRITIVAEDASNNLSNTYTSDFSKNRSFGWPFVNMEEILSQRKGEYLPKDILTVRCRLWKGEGNAETVAPICARTRIGIEHISFLHTVEGFNAFEANQKQIYQTHSFPKKRCFKSSLYISDSSCCDEKVMVQIMAAGRGKILAKCEISLIEISGKKIKCAEADNRFDAKRKDIGKLPLSLTKDAILSKKSEYLPNDKLSLLCECIFSTGIEFEKIEGLQNEITTSVEKTISYYYLYLKEDNISAEKLSACPSALDDLKRIYSNKFLTDVELKTKANSFPAHKIVLCARSPVFSVMMSSDMKEKYSDSIPVDDLSDDTVEQLLLFLYSDKIEDLEWESAIKLYYAADKYQVEKLKLLCSSFLIDNLSITTAPELLLLADIHSDFDLKKVAEDFICGHDEQVFGSCEWEKLMEANPQLALKTFHSKYKRSM